MAASGPKFELIARAKLKLSDAHDSIKTHDLLIENVENRLAQLPLFGHYCCRLAVQPDCVADESLSGYLKVLEHYFEKGTPAGQPNESKHDEHLYWASLKNLSLSLWIKRSQDTPGKSLRSARDNPPDLVIPVKKTTKTKRGSNSFSIISAEGEVFVISVLNKDDLQLWVSHVDRQIQDHLLWDTAADTVMEILTPSPTRNPLFMKSRAPGALYDETPLSGKFRRELATTRNNSQSVAFTFRAKRRHDLCRASLLAFARREAPRRAKPFSFPHFSFPQFSFPHASKKLIPASCFTQTALKHELLHFRAQPANRANCLLLAGFRINLWLSLKFAAR